MTDYQTTIGIARIKNVSGAPYTIEEMPGVTMPDQGEIDLMDQELPEHYVDWDAANRLLTKLTTAKLYQDIQAGKIQVLELVSPIGPR